MAWHICLHFIFERFVWKLLFTSFSYHYLNGSISILKGLCESYFHIILSSLCKWKLCYNYKLQRKNSIQNLQYCFYWLDLIRVVRPLLWAWMDRVVHAYLSYNFMISVLGFLILLMEGDWEHLLVITAIIMCSPMGRRYKVTCYGEDRSGQPVNFFDLQPLTATSPARLSGYVQRGPISLTHSWLRLFLRSVVWILDTFVKILWIKCNFHKNLMEIC